MHITFKREGYETAKKRHRKTLVTLVKASSYYKHNNYYVEFMCEALYAGGKPSR